MRRERTTGSVRILQCLGGTIIDARGWIRWVGKDGVRVPLKFEVVVPAIVIGQLEILLSGDTFDGCSAGPPPYKLRYHQARRAGIRWILYLQGLSRLMQELM